MSVPADFIWTEPYTHGFCVMNTSKTSKEGKTMAMSFTKFSKRIQFIAHIEDQWCYMGTFKVIEWTTLDPHQFAALPADVSTIFIFSANVLTTAM